MKLIPLSRGQFAKVDNEDYEYLSRYKWFALENGRGLLYASRRINLPNGKRPGIMMHRVIMGASSFKEKVDHENHDTLDNQRHNLRIATNSQNMMNRNWSSASSKSGHRGVSWNKKDCKWRAQISINLKVIHLGNFTDKSDAASAYAEANRKYFGDFGGIVK